MDVVSFGNKVVMYGGVAVRVFNDIRSLETIEYTWKVLKDDQELPDFYSRFGHSCNGFDRYIFIFGGCGPYSRQLKKRNCFNETIVFDIEQGKYCKIEGSKASLQSELYEHKYQKSQAKKGIVK